MTNLIIPAVYKHLPSGKNYHAYDVIKNMTLDTTMIMYRDKTFSYVREYPDFMDKFEFVSE